MFGEPSERPGHLRVSPQCHLHLSCPLLPPPEPPLVTPTGSKIGLRAQGGETAPEEPRRSFQVRWKVGAASPRQEPLHRPRGDIPGVLCSPLGRWPLSQLSGCVPVAAGGPGGSLGTTPGPHPSPWHGAPVGATSPGAVAAGGREGGPGEPRTVARGPVSPQEGTKTWPRGI